MAIPSSQKIEPFPFDELPQYTQEELHSISMLSRMFPATGIKPDFLEIISDSLQKTLGGDTNLIYESVFYHQANKIKLTLPKNFAGFNINLSKDYLPIFFYFENHLSLSLVDRMLGGSGSIMDQSRSLSALEEGVMQYFVVTLMAELTKQLPQDFSLKLNQMCSYPEDVDSYWKTSMGFHVVHFRVELKMIQGFIKLFIPQDVVVQLNQDFPQFMNQKEQIQEYLQKRVINFSHLKTVVWAEAGEVSLSQEELNQINEGDIILFDKAYPRMEEGELMGEIYLRLGLGKKLGIKSTIQSLLDDEFKFRLSDSFIENDE